MKSIFNDLKLLFFKVVQGCGASVAENCTYFESSGTQAGKYTGFLNEFVIFNPIRIDISV